jgi:hypothetical protein
MPGSPARVRIEGTVTDSQSKSPMVSLLVQLQLAGDPQHAVSRSTQTDAQGR